MTDHLTVAAVCVLDPTGRVFLVRKHGTTAWMQPGGKLEPGESPTSAAVRELSEELGVAWDASRLSAQGRWDGDAANEPDTTMTAHLFTAHWDPVHDGVASVGAELAEGAWFLPHEAAARDDLAPLLREAVLPALLAR